MPSIKTNKSLPPSSAGKGSRLIMARFIEISAVRETMYVKPSFVASPTTPAIPIGPET